MVKVNFSDILSSGNFHAFETGIVVYLKNYLLVFCNQDVDPTDGHPDGFEGLLARAMVSSPGIKSSTVPPRENWL